VDADALEKHSELTTTDNGCDTSHRISLKHMKHFATSSLFATEKVRRYYETEERESAVLDHFFWQSFEYLRTNDLVGDYTEFGCGFMVRSFRLASKYRAATGFKGAIVAFDSFEGMPAFEAHDSHPGWEKGAMAVSQDEFRDLLRLQGLEPEEYRIIPGFFQQSLCEHVANPEYGILKVAFAYIDCDLYESTRLVLPFLGPVLVDGAIVAFDDWNCFRADPACGQRRAAAEFLGENIGFAFQPFVGIGWHGQAFIVRKSGEPTKLDEK
jgi:hypothetical protein